MNNSDINKTDINKRASFLSSFGVLIFSVSLMMTFRWLIWEPFVIPSGSMIPTLLINDHIVVAKYSFGFRVPFTEKWVTSIATPDRGDVVVFRSVEQDIYMIKRVIGLPGEEVEMDPTGQILINGQSLKRVEVAMDAPMREVDVKEDPSDVTYWQEKIGEHEPITLQMKADLPMVYPKFKVPEGHLFMMGDNRDRSRDSRYWGALPMKNLIGKAKWVWLSCDQTLSNVNFLCDPRTIRWQRFFHRIE